MFALKCRQHRNSAILIILHLLLPESQENVTIANLIRRLYTHTHTYDTTTEHTR